jgi:multidrug resistance protein, MATE family
MLQAEVLSDAPPPLPKGWAGVAALLRLAMPIALSRFGFFAMVLCDTIVIGHFAPEELAFLALAWTLTGIVLMAAGGLLQGVQVETSRWVGRGKPEQSRRVFLRGIGDSLVLGVVTGLIVYFATGPVLTLFQLDPFLVENGSRVARIIALSVPFHLLYIVGAYFLEAHRKPLLVTAAIIAANLLNLGMNLYLVGGLWNGPGLGAEGIAWATFGARCVLAAGLLIPAFLLCRNWRPGPSPVGEAWSQRRVGIGAGLSNGMEAGAFNACNIVAGLVSVAALNAFTIGINIVATVFMLAMGLAAASSVQIAEAWGREDRAAVRHAGGLAFRVTVVVLGLVGCMIWIAQDLVAAGLTSDKTIQATLLSVLGLIVAVLIFDGLQVVAAYSLRAIGDVWWATALHLGSYGLVMLPLSIVLGLHFGLGLAGMYWAILIASVFAAVVLTVRFTLHLRTLTRLG